VRIRIALREAGVRVEERLDAVRHGADAGGHGCELCGLHGAIVTIAFPGREGGFVHQCP
jgi:hypothetical protein